jgi:predicted ATPase
VQVIRAYVRTHEVGELSFALGSAAPEIAQIVPEIRDRLPHLPTPAALEPEQARFRLFDGVTSFCRRVVAVEPLLLILDDLHLADKPSLLLLSSW